MKAVQHVLIAFLVAAVLIGTGHAAIKTAAQNAGYHSTLYANAIDRAENDGAAVVVSSPGLDVAGTVLVTGDVCISGGNCLSSAGGGGGTDDQMLGTSGNSITLEDGGSVIAPYANNANNLDGLNSNRFLRSDQNDRTSENLGVDGTFDVNGDVNFDSDLNVDGVITVGTPGPYGEQARLRPYTKANWVSCEYNYGSGQCVSGPAPAASDYPTCGSDFQGGTDYVATGSCSAGNGAPDYCTGIEAWRAIRSCLALEVST